LNHRSCSIPILFCFFFLFILLPISLPLETFSSQNIKKASRKKACIASRISIGAPYDSEDCGSGRILGARLKRSFHERCMPFFRLRLRSALQVELDTGRNLLFVPDFTYGLLNIPCNAPWRPHLAKWGLQNGPPRTRSSINVRRLWRWISGMSQGKGYAYPLPCDMPEIHRQSLRTLMLLRVLGGPFCNPHFEDAQQHQRAQALAMDLGHVAGQRVGVLRVAKVSAASMALGGPFCNPHLANRPPKRILEVACGSGLWSGLCHEYFARNGHPDVAFAGIDVISIAPDMRRTRMRLPGYVWEAD
jgi:hypothetical protein